jgi:hypothetical protein
LRQQNESLNFAAAGGRKQSLIRSNPPLSLFLVIKQKKSIMANDQTSKTESDITEEYLQAANAMRRFQWDYGQTLPSHIQRRIDCAWARALDVDPKGSQLKYVVEEAYELATPMRE